jgi:DNA (cytosine-5)-methyltransferase 1
MQFLTAFEVPSRKSLVRGSLPRDGMIKPFEATDLIVHSAPRALTCIDLFAGCGGLSLGLHQAGWEGVFALERSPMAFETLNHNLVSKPTHFPHWPSWFPREACSIQKLTKKYRLELKSLRGEVMLIAGGPPCQGFSYAGKRQKHDHRNQLYKSYLEVVGLVRPALVLLENVTGITREFGGKKKRGRGRPPMPYSKRIKRALEKKFGYEMCETEVLASDFGVPQSRVRFVAIGVDRSQFPRGSQAFDPDELLGKVRQALLTTHGLPVDRPISCREALSDLEYDDSNLADSPDTKSYKAGRYSAASTSYQRLMRGTARMGDIADSHRFVKHHQRIVARFTKIRLECPLGKNLPDDFRKRNGIKKACIVPLDPKKPAPTLTTIPDDMIHYGDSRVLTVRECARLQSFPDWFAIKNKYTTGGSRRKTECPRYTQVGNAVPPLLAEALGRALVAWVTSQAADKAPADTNPPVPFGMNESLFAFETTACEAVS